MSLAVYQKEIDDILQQLETPYWQPLSQLARMIEEVGEVSRIINDKYGEKPKKKGEILRELADELADVMFTIICLANQEGIKLDPALKRAIVKLNTRDHDRYKRKTTS